MPDLVEVARDYVDRGGVVIAVSQDLLTPGATAESMLPKVQAAMARLGIEFEVVLFDGEVEELNERFDLPGPIPATIAIDRSGEVVEVLDDIADKARFAELMQRALGQ